MSSGLIYGERSRAPSAVSGFVPLSSSFASGERGWGVSRDKPAPLSPAENLAGWRARAKQGGSLLDFLDGRVSSPHEKAPPIPLQAKLKVGAIDDPLEREADAVAERVMGDGQQPAPAALGVGAGAGAAEVRRKCAGCEEEELHRKGNPGPAPREAPHSVHAVLQSPGRPLEAAARSFMEPRFGADFGHVRVHSDSRAAASADAIDALAYTVGNHVVLGTGQDDWRGESGRRLLAHELAHVVQSARESSPSARRAVARDFRITQIDPSDASDPSTIFFSGDSVTLTPGERAKIAPLATPAARNLTLNGFQSEEGTPAANNAIIQARLAAVSAALASAGHTGARLRVNQRASAIGDINYRHKRAVEVLPTPVGGGPAPSAQSACGAPGSEVAPCGTALASALPVALSTVLAANALLALPAHPGATALLAQLFSGVPRATVVSRMTALATQVAGLPLNHRCHSSCDAGCGRPAYNSGPTGAVGGMLTLCPDFLTSSDVLWRARLLIHESAHGTPGFGAQDVAYSSTRQISFLSPADQLRNTDSYVLLAWLLVHPGSIPIGPTTADTLVGMTVPEQDAARRAVAWVESWLNYGDFDVENLYSAVDRSLTPRAWGAGDGFHRDVMHLLAPLFGLTNPGAAAPFTPPTAADKVKVAGIHDRFDQMYKSVDWQVLTVKKGTAASEAWGGAGATLPRLTQTVTLGPAFFGMTPVDQIKHLVFLMAKAMFGISAPFEAKYPLALDRIRQHRGLGP